MPDKIITPDRALRAIQSKLEKLELAHLRKFILQQEERIEALEHDLQNAHSDADGWRRDWFDLAHGIAEETGTAIAMTKDGQVGLVDRRDALIRKIAGLNPAAGEIGEGMLNYLVGEANILIGNTESSEGGAA